MLSLLGTLSMIILNVGWIAPLYLSGNAVIQWCRLEASPVIYDTPRAGNTFPFLEFAQTSLVVACVWVAIAMTTNTLLRYRTTAPHSGA